MLIYSLQFNENYLVYGIYEVNNEKRYICCSERCSWITIFSDEKIQMIDNKPSIYWKKYNENRFMPEEWNEEGFLYRLIDEASPLKEETFKTMKEKIDEEFDYYELGKIEPDSEITAEVLEDNWVLCPKCSEAFEVTDKKRIIECPNTTCMTRMNNPLYRKREYSN